MIEPSGDGVLEMLDWTPWGAPRQTERGVETAFHHPLVMIRVRGGDEVRVVAPADALAGPEIEWSPMIWALRGRRHWRALTGLGPQKVFRGAGDRLFLIGDAACEQAFESDVLGARGLAGWVQTLERRIAFCEAEGIVYRHLVIPDGHAIYADAIPGAPSLAADRPLMQILRYGGEPIRARTIYPLDALIAGRATAETSYPHDVHVTGYGCFLVYRALMAALPGVDPAHVVREDQLKARQILIAGDVARSVGLPARRVEVHEPPPVAAREIIKGTAFKRNQVDVWRTEAKAAPRLVLFRSSNSTRLVPFLLRHFSRIVAVATQNAHYDLIRSEKPDVVMCEMPERYFAGYQTSPNETDRGGPPFDAEGFEAATGYKLPLPD